MDKTVQYVQQASAVALPSSHARKRYAQQAPVVYGQPRPITSQGPVAQASTVVKPTALAVTTFKAPVLLVTKTVPAQSTNKTATGRAVACQLPSTMLTTCPPAPSSSKRLSCASVTLVTAWTAHLTVTKASRRRVELRQVVPWHDFPLLATARRPRVTRSFAKSRYWRRLKPCPSEAKCSSTTW